MSPKQITIVVIRLLLLYAAIRGFGAIIAAFIKPAPDDYPLWQYSVWLAFMFAVWFGGCLWFWKLAPRLAARLLPDSSAEPEPLPQSPMLWLHTGLVLMGIWLVATSIGPLVTTVYQSFYWRSMSWISFLPDSITLLCGLLLSLQPRRISRWVRKAVS